MKKYRVRQGSFIDYFRYGMTGLLFGALIAWAAINTYPIY